MTAVDLPTGKDLAEYDGFCVELVDVLLKAHGGDLLYVEPLDGVFDVGFGSWRYHAALVLDGLVYDAWHPDVRLPPAEYVAHVFGDDVTWEINPGREDDEGPALSLVFNLPCTEVADVG